MDLRFLKPTKIKVMLAIVFGVPIYLFLFGGFNRLQFLIKDYMPHTGDVGCSMFGKVVSCWLFFALNILIYIILVYILVTIFTFIWNKIKQK